MSTIKDENALPAGSKIQEFEVESVLGVGSFGIVYRAKNKYFDEVVAIKEFLPKQLASRVDGSTVVPTSSDNEEIYRWGLKKFVNEAKLLWELSQPVPHRNIIRVSRFHEAHGTAYMVMDYEEGEPLSDLLRREGKLRQQDLVGILYPLLDGLQRVHAKQVFHRDIKPPNVLVRPDGSPVLIDFGAARWEAANDGSSLVSILTPEYAAPEQSYAGGEIGAWTDIYALAATAYRAITGQPPAPASERVLTGHFLSAADAETNGPFDKAFLAAVDAGLALLPQDRPVSVDVWRKRLRGERIEGEADETIIIASGPGRTASAETKIGPIAAAPGARAPVVNDGDAAPTRVAPSARRGEKAGSDRDGASRGRAALLAGAAAGLAIAAGAAWYWLRPADVPPGPVATPESDSAPEPVPSVQELVDALKPKEQAASDDRAGTEADAGRGDPGTAVSDGPGDVSPPDDAPVAVATVVPDEIGTGDTPSDPPEKPDGEPATSAEIIASLRPDGASGPDTAPEDAPGAPPSNDTIKVERELSALIDTLECRSVRLSWPRADRSVVALSGIIGAARERQMLRAYLEPLEARGLRADLSALDTLAAPFCRPVALLAGHDALAGGPDARPRIGLAKQARSYLEGDKLEVTLTAPADGYLHLSYVSPDGSVYHLLPSDEYPDNALGRGGRVVVGRNGEYEISEPHGDNLLIAIATPRLLFERPRPFDETVQSFEAALALALARQTDGQPDSGARPAASYTLISTSAR